MSVDRVLLECPDQARARAMRRDEWARASEVVELVEQRVGGAPGVMPLVRELADGLRAEIVCAERAWMEVEAVDDALMREVG